MALIAAAVLVFAGMDATTKHLATTWNVPLVIALRYFGNLALLLAIFAPREGRALVQTRRTGLVVVRSLSLVLSSLFAGLALQRMPVAETTAIVFLAPFGSMLLAGRLLGERVAPAGWVSAALGFAGVLMIVRPGSGLDPWGVGFALAAAATSITYNLLSRVLSRSETTPRLMFGAALAGALCFGAALPWSWRGPMPGLLDTTLFAGIGVMALAGHFLFTAAYRHAPASALAPVNYLQLVWAGLLGWLVFGHLPDAFARFGMLMVAGSGALAALIANPPGPAPHSFCHWIPHDLPQSRAYRQDHRSLKRMTPTAATRRISRQVIT
jgi:drug/metabolite transporter (DMT)-like permease